MYDIDRVHLDEIIHMKEICQYFYVFLRIQKIKMVIKIIISLITFPAYFVPTPSNNIFFPLVNARGIVDEILLYN